MSLIKLCCITALGLLAACQSAARFAGPPLPLPAELAGDARVFHRDVLLDPNYLTSFDSDREAKGEEFISTFRDEVGDQLERHPS